MTSNKTCFCFSNAPDALGRRAPDMPLSEARPTAGTQTVHKGYGFKPAWDETPILRPPSRSLLRILAVTVGVPVFRRSCDKFLVWRPANLGVSLHFWVRPSKCRENDLNAERITFFQILSNSLSTTEPAIPQYVNWNFYSLQIRHKSINKIKTQCLLRYLRISRVLLNTRICCRVDQIRPLFPIMTHSRRGYDR